LKLFSKLDATISDNREAKDLDAAVNIIYPARSLKINVVHEEAFGSDRLDRRIVRRPGLYIIGTTVFPHAVDNFWTNSSTQEFV